MNKIVSLKLYPQILFLVSQKKKMLNLMDDKDLRMAYTLMDDNQERPSKGKYVTMQKEEALM